MEIDFVDYAQKEEELAVFYNVPADTFYEQKFSAPAGQSLRNIRFYIHPSSDSVVFSVNGSSPKTRSASPSGLELVTIPLENVRGPVRLRLNSGSPAGRGVVITDLTPVY